MLIVEFLQYHSVLCGRVLAMSEDLRNKGALHEMEAFSISSEAIPALTGDRLYIRGSNTENDETVFSYQYSSTQKASEAKSAFSRMIRELNIENCYSCQPEIVGV